jgi:hypothetical protein
MTRWTAADIPDQHGRTVIITGANSGLGAEATRVLAEAGAKVIMACRDPDKAQAIADAIDGDTEVRRLDLADLASVRAFTDGLGGDVDVLINNAGVMAVPKGSRIHDDLNWERRHYQRWLAYAQSKLANLLFAYELQRTGSCNAAAIRPWSAQAAHRETPHSPPSCGTVPKASPASGSTLISTTT